MGRRGSGARFRPGVWVFPGGGLERQDFRARPAQPLASDTVGRMAVANRASKANALAMAAVREAFEEAGLLFGVPGDVGEVGHATWAEFRRRERTPDLHALDFLGRAITPSFRPIRFHARFFAVDADHVEGRLAGDGELEDLRWVRTDRPHGLETMIVQDMIVETLDARLGGRDAPPRCLFYNWGRRNVIEI